MRTLTRSAACACVLLYAAASLFAADEPVDADVLLKGAIVYDGTGDPGRPADIAIRGGTIVAVGEFDVGLIGREIDCAGLVVAPGFIDLHNHSDRQIIDRVTRANVNYLLQGCTTIVTGNCGAGWVDAGDFYDKIDAEGAGTNVAHLLPQGALRDEVMGTAQRPPTDEELQQMKHLAEQAMQDGVWGMSTGLIYVPSSYADTAEIVEIAKVVSDGGGIYVSHIRNENLELLAAVAEALSIGRQAGLPVHISHFKSSGRDSWGLVRRAADMIEAARKAGERVTADQYPYTASSTSLDATLIPTWARAGGREALLERFGDAETADRIRQAMIENLKRRDGGETLQIARYAKRPAWVGKRLSEIAQQEDVSPLEMAIRISQTGGASIVNFSMSEEDVRHVMQRPWVATASDGRAQLPNANKPHPRSYGTFARKLGHYSIREKVLPLREAVRSASGLPADILGITDRGYVREGLAADLVVFDPDAFLDRATFTEPHRYSTGVEYVFVNGRPAVFEGQPTGALAGKALRHTAEQGAE